MTESKRTELNLFLGKTKGLEYVFLDEAFDHGNGFKGLTYNVFTFHTEEEKERADDQYFEDEDSVVEWFTSYIKRTRDRSMNMNDFEDLVRSENPNGVAFDDSYCGRSWLRDIMKEASEKDGEDYEYSDCIGGGRMGKDFQYTDRENYEYVNEENFEKFILLYNEYEK